MLLDVSGGVLSFGQMVIISIDNGIGLYPGLPLSILTLSLQL